MKNQIQELYLLEQLSGGDTCVHRLHPMAKLLAAAVFIVTVVSFDKYAFTRLVPYIFYPTLLMALSETPYPMLFKRFMLALPFAIFAGITNIIFDSRDAFAIGGVSVSYGAISFFTILLKTYLCVMAVLTLVSVTPLSGLTGSMRRLRTPDIFIVMFEMTYRYIGVLLQEAYCMYTAYSLRSRGAKGIDIRDMGSFAGQLLIRGFDRAERVYNAMKCRGYGLHGFPAGQGRLKRRDIIFFAAVCFLCVFFRFVDIDTLFIGFSGGLGVC